MAYNTSSEYKQIIYSGDAKHKAYLSFNNIEFEDADEYLEKATITSRAIPNGNQGFYLSNFVSNELELVLHRIPNNIIIQDQIEFKIGTLVQSNYEYVPIGKFNIQDSPTTDKDKTIIKLRDNSVKFDFDYNAEPLITENNGSATLLQILQDICDKAGVGYVGSVNFLGYDKSIGIYDNTIKARMYVSYIAEQAGCIATIDRNGNLTFIPLNSLTTIQIPLNIVEKYDIGDLFKITRVCYESGIIKYENPIESDETNTHDTLFLDAANPFINAQEQIDDIKQLVNGFEIYSLKTGKIIGNPAIDSYDIIEIIDTDNDNQIIGKTLATNILTYNGVCIQTFDTTITKASKIENVTINGEPTFRKWAKTEIDNVNGKVEIQTGIINDIQEEQNNFYTKEQVNSLVINSENGLINTFTSSGGNNLLKNTALYFKTNDGFDYWVGSVSKINISESLSQTAMLLKQGILKQTISIPNGVYSVSFNYKKLNPLGNASVRYNGKEITLEEEGRIETTGEITTNSFEIEFVCDIDDSYMIYDLMLNVGEKPAVWSQSQNEIHTTNVNISKNISVEATENDTIGTFGANGVNVINKNTNEVVLKATDTGIETTSIVAQTGVIGGVSTKKVGNQSWQTGV